MLWSPDATWIACLVRSMNPRSDRQVLVAAPLNGGKRDTLFDGPRAWPWVWACDGNIHYWDELGTRHALPPPKAWSAQKPSRLAPRSEFVWGDSRTPRVFRPCSGSDEVHRLPAIDSLAGTGYVLVYDEFTDGKRFLIHGPGAYSHPGGGFIVDDQGTILDSLGWEVSWTSVSSDGQFVVGQLTVDDGHAILSSKLFLGDVHGRWRREIPRTDGALDPHLSREGFFISYQQHRHSEDRTSESALNT